MTPTMSPAPASAIALHADTSSLTAIGNDFGFAEVYARQVRAHAQPGDIVLLLSTSGRSPNLIAAADAARRCRAECWALTGPAPNPLAVTCTDAVCLPGDTAAVQESHLAAVHMICRVVEQGLEHGTALSAQRLRALPRATRRPDTERSMEAL
ncbi:D-sedoheptulose-7-phosphate isomerase [Pseudonocardia asaccharolytica]|uniref:SIS domain-containing protein n=1 Tax=Pseudonocardia asaccharolytica DSM 44247 = NBRC 16224 TaxID=1123024 RepID=A0A511CXY4_9PSEU|nr:SIS domain-containing protein [Pseudonocardia asaccharolytica]GEL17317.1 hypothetical protein PA7_11540 [Pseudonocardia asaccharolytica DSM 44247 = NBRC 16224]